MITGDKLLDFLKKHGKNDRDLLEYVLNGLKTYYASGKRIHPINVMLVRHKFKLETILREHDRACLPELLPQDTLERRLLVRRSVGGPSILEQKQKQDSQRLERARELHQRISLILDKQRQGIQTEVKEFEEAFSWEPMAGIAKELVKYHYHQNDVLKYIEGYPRAAKNKEDPPYLNPGHPYYSTELATAVRTWLAMYNGSKEFDKYKTHKQQIEDYLLSSDSNLSERAIERIATVVNPDPRKRKPRTSRRPKTDPRI